MADRIQDVIFHEDQRYAALLAKDAEALDRLLHPHFTMMHSNGLMETKASYLAGVTGGMLDYRRIERSEQHVTIEAEVALVLNRLGIDILVNAVARSLDVRTLSVWSSSGGGWSLLALHSSPVPSA